MARHRPRRGRCRAFSAILLILDLGLPDIDGVDVARRVRDQGLTVPILMLTARADEVDLVVGLDAGADDYVTKPFRLAELLGARARPVAPRRGDAREWRASSPPAESASMCPVTARSLTTRNCS